MSTQNLTKEDEAEIRRLVLKNNGRRFSGSAWINYKENGFLVEMEDGVIKRYRTYVELLQDPEYVKSLGII